MKVMLADFHKFIGYSGGIENVFAKMASPSFPCPRA